MAQPASLPADRQLLCLELFNKRLREDLLALISEDLIDEHRLKPLGRHSDPLERILNFIHRAPSFALYSRTPCREYQIVHLPVVPGERPQTINDIIYSDENEALHAVFLEHLSALKKG
jgi:branched-chain amino acid transport system permease protein